MVGYSVRFPVKENIISWLRGIRSAFPLIMRFEPVDSHLAGYKGRNATALDISALICTPWNKASAPFNTVIETVPCPVRFASYVSELWERFEYYFMISLCCHSSAWIKKIVYIVNSVPVGKHNSVWIKIIFCGVDCFPAGMLFSVVIEIVCIFSDYSKSGAHCAVSSEIIFARWKLQPACKHSAVIGKVIFVVVYGLPAGFHFTVRAEIIPVIAYFSKTGDHCAVFAEIICASVDSLETGYHFTVGIKVIFIIADSLPAGCHIAVCVKIIYVFFNGYHFVRSPCTVIVIKACFSVIEGLKSCLNSSAWIKSVRTWIYILFSGIFADSIISVIICSAIIYPAVNRFSGFIIKVYS